MLCFAHDSKRKGSALTPPPVSWETKLLRPFRPLKAEARQSFEGAPGGPQQKELTPAQKRAEVLRAYVQPKAASRLERIRRIRRPLLLQRHIRPQNRLASGMQRPWTISSSKCRPEMQEPLPDGALLRHYRRVHHHLFQDVYPGGKVQDGPHRKGRKHVLLSEHIASSMDQLFKKLALAAFNTRKHSGLPGRSH